MMYAQVLTIIGIVYRPVYIHTAQSLIVIISTHQHDEITRTSHVFVFKLFHGVTYTTYNNII